MKTRELTADDVNITISEKDISKIKFDNKPKMLIDENAAEALMTGMKIRGRGTNIFVCGPSAPEREAAVLEAAASMRPGRTVDIVISEKAETAGDILTPGLHLLEPGKGADFVKAKQSEGKHARLLHTADSLPPIIIEENPVPSRLFGSAGIFDPAGLHGSPFSAVSPGSLAESAGGIIVINAEDMLEEPLSWKLLRRVLRSGKITIGEGRKLSNTNPAAGSFILPSINLDLKVVMLGNESHFDHLYNNDEDFRELFQFFAELNSVIDMTPQSIADSVNYFRNFCINKLESSLTDAAALELLKYSIAAAENREKLSTITSEIELILSEAISASSSASASKPEDQNKKEILAADIIKVIDKQSSRFSLLERTIIEDIETGVINLQVDGSEIGKVNGLSVIEKGPWAFGSPGLISARIAPGENGLVNIEHEAGLSGEIHDKWVLILEGFLRSRFAHDFPLSIFASICFEQSYSEIDGDSASSSELYALLSAIAGVPLRQDIAVTGSLSQTGEIQAVGGLREKIDGFYKACRAINFTGRQGVIVPERNIKNIIIPDYIIDDIRAGIFHIYPVSTVDDSMEILTGMESGHRNPRGLFPNGSLNYLIEKNLKKIAAQAKNFVN